MAGLDNLKPFKKGDKRINRKGRPKDMAGLRQLAQTIAHEDLPSGDGLTVVEAILRRWAGSKDPRLQIQFMETAFGKVAQPTENKTELTGANGGPVQTASSIEVKNIDYRADIVSSEPSE